MSMVEQARQINRISVPLAILGLWGISHLDSVDAQGITAPTGTPTPLTDCLVRLRLSAQFSRGGVIIATAPNRSYLVEAGSNIAKVVTNQQGVGINQSNGREVTEFIGARDTRLPDGRPARSVRIQSLDSGQSERVDAACKGPNDPATEVNKVVDVGQTQQTPGTGPTFQPRGTRVGEIPAPETPGRTATAVATNTPRAEGTPVQTQVATAHPTQAAKATPAPTPVTVAGTSSTLEQNPLEGIGGAAKDSPGPVKVGELLGLIYAAERVIRRGKPALWAIKGLKIF